MAIIHSCKATGITQYLKNGGRREIAQQMTAHESPRTTALYDRWDDDVAVDEVERKTQMCYDNTDGSCTENLAGMGNITSRSDVASGAAWTYDPTHKHQVTQAGSSSYTYSYDTNGNAKTMADDVLH